MEDARERALTSGVAAIGTEGSMATRLSEDECRQPLEDEMRSRA
jgi:hypothetical protein